MLKQMCFPRVAYLFGQVPFWPAVVFILFYTVCFLSFQIYNLVQSLFWLSTVLGFKPKFHNKNPIFISLVHFEICIVKRGEEISVSVKCYIDLYTFFFPSE